MNWRSPRAVVLLVGVVCLALFLAGIGAAILNRHNKICGDGKAPVQQRGGLLGQVVVKCHDGQIVTLNN